MIAVLRSLLGGGASSDAGTVTIPSMDGAMQPNEALDQADVILGIPAPDNLVACGTSIRFTSGPTVFQFGDGDPTPLFGFGHDIACVAARPSGTMAVGLADGTLHVRGGVHDGTTISALGNDPIVCPTGLAFLGDDTLLVSVGSARHAPMRWRRDLMDQGRSGSVWRIDLRSKAADRLAGDLRYPAGLMPLATGGVVVSESWAHRLVEVGADGRVRELVGNLPAYPGRLAATTGGAWLSLFAPRRSMVEFVLRERGFRQRMMREVDEAFWIAPALSSGRNFREPLMGGAVKQLGILKPWAPTLSYGLLVRLDADFQPAASFHSRGDGRRHGITSSLVTPEGVLFTSRGGDMIGRIDASTAGGRS